MKILICFCESIHSDEAFFKIMCCNKPQEAVVYSEFITAKGRCLARREEECLKPP